METLTTVAALRERVRAWQTAGLSVGFVPTMGFLHAGHASLMALARPRCDRLVVSIFVNPLQFGPNEDLSRYPRDLAGDERLCAAEGVDVVFAPTDFYPPDRATTVSVAGLTEGLCGAARPGHFDGVTTVVARLFGVVQPQLAVFGEKDFQQLAVIRRMTTDLGLPVEIVGGPLIRDPDGLAMSSRNTYLSADERRRALSLSAALRAVVNAATAGERDVDTLRAAGRAALEVDRLDYFEIVDPGTLAPLATLDRPARVLVAGWIGRTRLIDNMAVPWI